MQRTIMALVMAAFLFSGAPVVAQPRGQVTIQDVPTGLVGGGVDGYTLAAPKVFWYNGIPGCPPRAMANAQYTQNISRIATYGSNVRTVYSQGENCGGGKIRSTIAADANYIYWLGSNGAQNGLIRLSTNANPGDTPELVNALVPSSGEVVDGGDKIFYLGPSGPNTVVGYVLKSNNQYVPSDAVAGTAANLSYAGGYAYYIRPNRDLVRINIGVDNQVIATGVNGYYAEGRQTICTITSCQITNRVYLSQGINIRYYSNAAFGTGGSLIATPVYTSGDASANIQTLTTTGAGGKLFFVETRTGSCSGLICNYTAVVVRNGRSSGTTPEVLVTNSTSTIYPTTLPTHLTNDGTFLFWQESDTLQRLAADAASLPVVNMQVFAPSNIGNGIEVTQGIQSLDNTVLLVQNRRTFVRVYAKSVSTVAGVTAELTGFVGRTNLGTLSPVNPVGTKISVRPSPNRTDLNQSFLFELPWSWTTSGALSLRATVNPNKVPLEPNYSDNTATVGPLTFKPSPKLSIDFFRLNYTSSGTNYEPRVNKDVLQTYSWLLRAYPIGGAIGQNLKPRLWDVAGGTKLGNWVNQSSGDCDKVENDQKDRALCASYYTNGWLKYYRDHAWVPNTTDFYYGMIADGAAFPRGQAIYSQTSVGPAGSGTFGWDNDGSYADWYAGHEIGHSLGRAHPNAGSDNPATNKPVENCGHSRSDPGFPYGNLTSSAAPIGPPSGSIEGFDGGDGGFGIARAVYPSSTWNDVMSYCSNQWMSDYTYTAMYNYMIANPSAAAATVQRETRVAPAASGDFLSIGGLINAEGTSGSFGFVRRLSEATASTRTPSSYALRLLNASSATLAEYSFTPTANQETTSQSFDLVVNFAAGTRAIQLVNNGVMLATQAVSANSPVISNVALQGSPDPVSGVVTLGWNASDPDGDALTFDVFYSRDNGATYQPVTMGATGSSSQIDTATLGGSGTATLRVVASDGVNVAEASSAPFVMAEKPPQPYILSPGATARIQYGQLVNFSGMAFDAQDGTVAESGLVWTDAKGATIGTGPLVSSTTLPVGSNLVTLTATNSAGKTATATVTVIVDDDLNLPGPTLTAGPGQIGWQVGAGETTAQTSDVTISNSGGGTLDWTATSDQPWLTLSAASGTIASDGDPATLTLTANPTGLSADQPHTATVTITRPAAGSEPAQTITIPINLNIGNVWNTYTPVPAPILPGGGKVYLPIMVR